MVARLLGRRMGRVERCVCVCVRMRAYACVCGIREGVGARGGESGGKRERKERRERRDRGDGRQERETGGVYVCGRREGVG